MTKAEAAAQLSTPSMMSTQSSLGERLLGSAPERNPGNEQRCRGRADFCLCAFSFATDRKSLDTLTVAAGLLWVKKERPFLGDSGTGQNGPQ